MSKSDWGAYKSRRQGRTRPGQANASTPDRSPQQVVLSTGPRPAGMSQRAANLTVSISAMRARRNSATVTAKERAKLDKAIAKRTRELQREMSGG
jgi:hypothetical protein